MGTGCEWERTVGNGRGGVDGSREAKLQAHSKGAPPLPATLLLCRERFLACLSSLKDKRQRTVYRLTLVKGWNMSEVQQYARLVDLGHQADRAS